MNQPSLHFLICDVHTYNVIKFGHCDRVYCFLQPPANFDNTEPPIAQMAAIVLEEPESSPPSDSPNDRSQRLKTASNFLQELDPQPAVSEEPPYHTDQAQVTVTEGAPVDSCLGFSIPSLHTTTGAQQLPPCSHFSQAPSVSWADLLKHKGNNACRLFMSYLVAFFHRVMCDMSLIW